jgi:hypothetical protein
VKERFSLKEVVDCAKVGEYRPEALRKHDEFKQFYPALPRAATAAPLGKSEQLTLPTQMPP